MRETQAEVSYSLIVLCSLYLALQFSPSLSYMCGKNAFPGDTHSPNFDGQLTDRESLSS